MRKTRALPFAVTAAVVVGLLTGIAGATTSPVPAATSGGWLQPETVAEGDIDAATTDFKFDRTSGLAAWRVLDSGIWRVQIAERDGPRSWTTPVTVSSPGVATETPRVARLWQYSEADDVSYEHLVAVWRAFDGAHWRIQYAIKASGSTNWSSPMMLSGAGQDAAEPVVDNGYGYTGESWIDVTWRRFDGTHWRIETKGVTESGASGTAGYLSPPGHDVKDLTNHPLLAWTQFDGTNWRAQVSHREDRGGYLLPGYPVSPPGEDALAPKVSYSAAVWRTFDGSNWRIRASRSRAYLTWRAPVSLSPAGTDAEGPEIGVCRDELLVIAWRQYDGTNWRVAERAYTDRWSPLAYLSAAGHDASSPAIGSTDRYSCGSVAAWTEPVDGHKVARATDLATSSGTDSVTTLSGVDADRQGVTTRDTTVAWLDATTTPKLLRLATLDNTGPYANLRVRQVQNGLPAPLTWWARDDWSKVASFDVYQYVIRWDATGWTRGRLLSNTTDRSWSSFRPGRTYCFRVRGRDAVGNIGAWSDYPRCTVTPVDDRRLVRTGHWSAQQGSRYFQGTYLRTRRQGSTLTLPNLIGIRRFGVLVATGPGNGRIRLSFSGFEPRVIDLDTPTRQWLVVRGMTAWAPYGSPGRLTVRVLSQGKPVRIDGVYAGRR